MNRVAIVRGRVVHDDDDYDVFTKLLPANNVVVFFCSFGRE